MSLCVQILKDARSTHDITHSINNRASNKIRNPTKLSSHSSNAQPLTIQYKRHKNISRFFSSKHFSRFHSSSTVRSMWCSDFLSLHSHVNCFVRLNVINMCFFCLFLLCFLYSLAPILMIVSFVYSSLLSFFSAICQTHLMSGS